MARLDAAGGAVGGAVSTGLRVARGMLAVVQGCDEGRGVGRLRAVLLGAGGRALGRGSRASLKLLADMATDTDVGWAPGATGSVRRGESGWAQAFQVSPGGGAGLTLARAEALDRDVQALAAGDGPQLTLVAIGDSIRPTDLGHRARMLGESLPTLPTLPTPHFSP